MYRKVILLCCTVFVVASIVSTGDEAYLSSVDRLDDRRIVLKNGAVAELDHTLIGSRVAGLMDAVLYRERGRWHLWLEGWGSFECALRERASGFRYRLTKTFIRELPDGYTRLITSEGWIYEIKSRDRGIAKSWQVGDEIIILSDKEVVSTDRIEGPISVKKLRTEVE